MLSLLALITGCGATTPEVKAYKEVSPENTETKPLYDYISGHDVNRLFCISREPHGHEAWKSEMVERLYGIPASHCFYTLEAKEKPQIVMDKVKELFPDISPESVVLMDDNDDTLGMYMAQTPFCTAHPMIFMEYL